MQGVQHDRITVIAVRNPAAASDRNAHVSGDRGVFPDPWIQRFKCRPWGFSVPVPQLCWSLLCLPLGWSGALLAPLLTSSGPRKPLFGKRQDCLEKTVFGDAVSLACVVVELEGGEDDGDRVEWLVKKESQLRESHSCPPRLCKNEAPAGGPGTQQ